MHSTYETPFYDASGTAPATSTMSQRQTLVSVRLPIASQQPVSIVPERPTSVSTASTVGSPFSPNPYSAPFSPCQSSPSQTEDDIAPGIPSLLDPNLSLSARKVKTEFLRRDFAFARLIVAILAQRIEMGILSPPNGIGFPFTDKEDRKKSCRPSGWDLELGFNVHSYRERYPHVLALAHQDLEIRGFIVDKLELEPDDNGIYIKYSLELPEH